MRFKLDENMPEVIAEHLRAQGCDVETVLSESMGGAPDERVVAAATLENRILITLDKGIANIQNPVRHAGLILLRLKHPSVNSILALVKSHLAALNAENLEGRIAVVSTSGIRVR